MNKSIAIIDDDRIIQESLRELFSDAGYAVFSAGDGIAGYDLVRREKPDLVLVDILLPRMHGVALCEKLRADDEFQGLRIILMTGVYKDVNLRMYVHKGLADDYIEKPFREKELLAKIEYLIGKGGARDESRPNVSAVPHSEVPGKDHDNRTVERELDDLINWVHGKKK
ncbi:MAG: response regulator [Candidatus Aminicenantes bacterium]|nr:response regulator [Candidatus Aminicenantes bacterium]